MATKSSAPKVPSVFPFKTCFYFKKNGQRIKVCPMNPAQRAEFDSGKRPALTEEQHTGFLAQLALDVAKDPDNDQKPETRIDTLADIYLESRSNLVCTEKLSQYSRTLQSFCEVCGGLPICKLTEEHVKKWVKVKGTTWKSTSTQRSNMKVVLQFVNYAMKKDYITKSPLAEIGETLDDVFPEAVREYCIYDSERKAMLANAPVDFKAVVLALLDTGRRPDEISNVLKKEVLRAADGLMWIMKHHKNSKKKKGAAETIHLIPELSAITSAALANPANTTPYLFVTKDGKPWTTELIRRAWNQTKKRAGLETESTPYSCRHSYITKALHNGLPMALVAQMVGNSVEVLAKHYAHMEKQQQGVYFRAAMQAVADCENYRSEAEAAIQPQAIAGKAAI